MKISILLPYKENYSPEYAGAVSLFVNATSKLSKYKSNITVYGSTSYKNYLGKNYVNTKSSRICIVLLSVKSEIFETEGELYTTVVAPPLVGFEVTYPCPLI